MKISNLTQAKIIWKLAHSPENKRKIPILASELELSYSSIAQNLSILVAGELIKKRKVGTQVFYVPSEISVLQAKEWLSITE